MIDEISSLGTVSDLFIVDVEALIEYFETLSNEVVDMKGYISRSINDFPEAIRYLEKWAEKLLTIEILLQRKVVKYRYHDRTAWSYIVKIDKQIEYILNIIKKMKEMYSPTNSYGLDLETIYRYLDEIYNAAQDGIKIVKRAIRDGAFE
jgi:hypothetical protein